MRALGSALAAVTLALAPAVWALEVKVVEPTPVAVGAEATLRVQVTGAVGEVNVTWRFDDGSTLGPMPNGTEVRRAWSAPGHYGVIVTARDQQGVDGDSFVQTVHNPLTPRPPACSSSIVYDAARKRVYSVNPDGNTLTAIDAVRLVKLGEITVFKNPRSIALAPDRRLWVSHQEDFAIAVIDPDRSRIVRAISLPYASQPVGLVMSPTGDAAYVALRAVGKVLKLHPTTGDVLGEIDVGPRPHALAVSYDGRRILGTRFFSPAEHGELFEIDAERFELARTFAIAADEGAPPPGEPDTDTTGRGIPNYLSAVVISPDGGGAWVLAKKDNTLRGLFRDGQPLTPENAVRSMAAVLDLSKSSESLRIDIDNRNLPSAVAFSALGDFVFIATEGNDLVEVRDAYTGASRGALSDAGHAPMGLALSGDDKLFVHGFLSRGVSVFDVRSVLSATPKLADIATVENETLAPEVLSGKRTFYLSADPRMSRDGYLSCATCHLEGFEDGRVFDFTDRGEGLRNTTSLLGRRGTGQGRLHWTANFDEVQDFEHDIRNAFGGTGFLAEEAFQTGATNQTLGDPKAGLSKELDELAAYVSSLEHVHASPFRNPDGTFTAAAESGRAIFQNLGCPGCHASSDFTDSALGELHDVGTLTPASGQRLGGELTGIDTPTLLGVWETAPYLHDGSAPTLRDVLVTRNPDGKHGATSSLSEQQLSDLEAYLLQLDSELPVRTLPSIEEEPRPSDPSEGCACRAARRPGRGAWLPLTIALALFLRRRRG